MAQQTGISAKQNARSFEQRTMYIIERPLVANGALSVENQLPLALSRNAVIASPFAVTITAGPARRIVTVLPRSRPTPIAPPSAIMAICRGTSRLFSPSSVEARESATAGRTVTTRRILRAALPSRGRR